MSYPSITRMAVTGFLGCLIWAGAALAIINDPVIDGADTDRFAGPPSYQITGDATGDALSWTLESPDGSVSGPFSGPEPSFRTDPLGGAHGLYRLRATQTLTGSLDPPGIAIRTFFIGPSAPTVLSGPPAIGNDATPSFAWSSPELSPPGTFQYQVDGGPFVGTGSAQNVTLPTALADGPHSFQVRAFDVFGNPGTISGAFAFAIDTTPPAAPSLGLTLPPVLTNVQRPTFTWSGPVGEVGGSYQVQIIGPTPIGPITRTSPFTVNPPLPALAAGTHTFQVRKVDAAGNVGAPAEHKFTIDLTPPTLENTPGFSNPVPPPGASGPFGPTANVQISFNEAIQVSSVRICLKGSCPTAIPATVNLISPTQVILDPAANLATATPYEIRFTVRDVAGNQFTGPSWTFTTSNDATSPGPVTGLTATAGIGQVALTWTRPGDPDLGRITVLRATAPPASPGEASALRFSLGAIATSFTDIGLTPGITYHYAVYTEDVVGNPSVLARATAVPVGPRVLAAKPNPPKTINARFMTPRRGKLIGTLRPILRWQVKKGAVLYNVQIVNLNTGRKVVSDFARKTRFRVPKGRLKAGNRFAWRVWAYRGRAKGYVKVPQTSWFDTSPRARK